MFVAVLIAAAIQQFIINQPPLAIDPVVRFVALNSIAFSLQSLVLLSGWWRRLMWVAVGFISHCIIPFKGPSDTPYLFWTNVNSLSFFLQSSLLIGERKRGWLLAIAIPLYFPMLDYLAPIFSSAYDTFELVIPSRGFWLSGPVASYLLLIHSPVGLLVAFLMPPIVPKQASNPIKE